MTVLTVGTGQEFSTITAAVAAARSGDTIDVQAGIYTNDFPALISNVTIEGVGGLVHLVATATPPNGKAIFDVAGTTTLAKLDFSGSAVAGIRYEGGNLAIDSSTFEHNQVGLLAASDPSGAITVSHSEFAFNGTNVDAGDVGRLSVIKSYLHDAAGGAELTSRAEMTIVSETRIFDNDGYATYSIDMPNGGNAFIQSDTIQKGANSQIDTLIAYGEAGALHASNQVTVAYTGLDSQRPNAFAFWDAAGVPFHLVDPSRYYLSSMQADRAGIVSDTGFYTILQPVSHDPDSPLDAGNYSPTPPVLSATSDIAGLTRSTTVNLSGLAISSPTSGSVAVEILDFYNGQRLDLGPAALAPDGSWRFTATGLADGVHQFFVAANAPNAGIGIGTGPDIRVDTAGPTLTAGASVAGTTAGTGIVLSGTAGDAGGGVAAVELFDTAGGIWTDLGKAVLSGGTWQFTAGHLAAGSHGFVAVASDAAGNYSATAAGSAVNVVATTPLQAAIQRIIGNIDGGVTILGTAAANSIVTIIDTSAGVTKTLGSVTANASGAFSLIAHTKVSATAANTFSASVTNAAGQQGSSTGLFQLSSAGNDTLSGTVGQSDVFATFLRTGQDTISGFETTRAVGAAHDVVNLSGTGFGSYGQVAPYIRGATSAVIQLDGTRSITLLGVSASALEASDFRFS